jgi:hypothetical protein
VRSDDFWLTRIRDNRMRGLLAELADAINDCEDAELLHLLKGSLRLGLANAAALKEDELRNARPTRKEPGRRSQAGRRGSSRCVRL